MQFTISVVGKKKSPSYFFRFFDSDFKTHFLLLMWKVNLESDKEITLWRCFLVWCDATLRSLFAALVWTVGCMIRCLPCIRNSFWRGFSRVLPKYNLQGINLIVCRKFSVQWYLKYLWKRYREIVKAREFEPKWPQAAPNDSPKPSRQWSHTQFKFIPKLARLRAPFVFQTSMIGDHASSQLRQYC